MKEAVKLIWMQGRGKSLRLLFSGILSERGWYVNGAGRKGGGDRHLIGGDRGAE